MKFLAVLLGLIMSTAALADSNWKNSEKAVLNYLEAIGKVQKIKDVPISMPKSLPNHGTYYMSVKKLRHNQYMISFDNSKNCKAVKTCNVGSVIATKYQNPEIYYNRNNKAITEQVILSDKTKAFFTPAHAMADYWPARLEWRSGPWLLQLNWNIKNQQDEKQVLVKLANQFEK